MRLSEEQRRIIRDAVAAVFGVDATLRLFGSRINDHARGGDIDLHIETEGDAADLLARELELAARLQRALGERRIDIVVRSRAAPMRAVDRHAVTTGVSLS